MASLATERIVHGTPNHTDDAVRALTSANCNVHSPFAWIASFAGWSDRSGRSAISCRNKRKSTAPSCEGPAKGIHSGSIPFRRRPNRARTNRKTPKNASTATDSEICRNQNRVTRQTFVPKIAEKLENNGRGISGEHIRMGILKKLI